MINANPDIERLRFLVKVVQRETKHLQTTDQRLFEKPFNHEMANQLESNDELAERVEAFISRFARLQDTIGDKLLPQLLSFLGERPGAAIDNIDRAERLGWIKSSDIWMETRKLRNQMVHEYIDDLMILIDVLNLGHERVSHLIYAAAQMLGEIEARLR